MAITVLTAVLAVMAFLTWRSYKRIEWFTGSMESHSAKQLQLKNEEMRKTGFEIELVWWDPTIEQWPTPDVVHGQPVRTDRVYFGVPVWSRRVQPTLRGDLKNTYRRWRDYITG